ncbi:MAG: histidinol-phosphate transaminase [Acidobacteriota bacterium]
MSIPVPPYIEAIRPYVPGKPVQEVERELGLKGTVKMASNENPLGPSPKAVEAVRAFLGDLHIYPEGSGFYLCQALARCFGVEAGNVVLGNGSVELVEMSARAYLNREAGAVYSAGSFAMYPIACQVVDAPQKAVPMRGRNHDLDALLAALDERTRLLILDNPINPTGRYVPRGELEAFLERVPPNVLVILDEAYKEFVKAPDYGSVMPLLSRFPNLLVLGTFSKAYGLAGLRVGYGVAGREVTQTLHKVRSPFNTTSAAQVAAMAALEDVEFVARGVALNARELPRLAAGCESLGLTVTPSVANFVLVDFPEDANDTFQALLREGVIVRPMKGNGYPRSLRVSVHTPEGNDRFLEAARKILGR